MLSVVASFASVFSLSSGLLSGPALFVVLLSVVFLVFPLAYLYMALRERGVFERFRDR